MKGVAIGTDVVDALHGSGSWLTENLSAVNPLLQYMTSIKALPDNDKWHQFARDWIKQWVKQKQLNFLKQAWQHREGFDDDLLMFAISLNTATKTPAGLYITRFLDEEEYEQSWLIGLRAVCTSTKLYMVRQTQLCQSDSQDSLLQPTSCNPHLRI